MQNYYLLLLLHVGQRAEKCSLWPLAIHQSYCDLSHKWRKLLHENAAVPEENLCDLSQQVCFTYLNMLWAHCGTGVHSEGLHWHLLTTHTSMSQGPRQGNCTPCDKNERSDLMYEHCHSNWLELLLIICRTSFDSLSDRVIHKTFSSSYIPTLCKAESAC